MTTKTSNLGIDKYDFGTFESVIEKLDSTGAIFNGTMEVNGFVLTIEYAEADEIHKVAQVVSA